MAATWSEIKLMLQTINPSGVGGLVNSTSELPSLAYLTNMRIAGNAYKFRSLLREGTVTLTGAGTYNLATLIPDFQQAYQIVDPNTAGTEVGYRPMDEFNVLTSGRIFTFSGKTLKVKEDPSSGTLTMPYYSNFLVLDDDGTTRKKNFENDGDFTVLYDDQLPMLIEGILHFVARRDKKMTDRTVQLFDGRVVQMDSFIYEMQQATMNDTPVNRSFSDYRYQA